MTWSQNSGEICWKDSQFGFSFPFPGCFDGVKEWRKEDEAIPAIDSLLAVEGYRLELGESAEDLAVCRGNSVGIELPYNAQRPTGFDFKIKDVSSQPGEFTFQWCFSANTSRLDESLELFAVSRVKASTVQLLNLDTKGQIIGTETLSSSSFQAGKGFFEGLGSDEGTEDKISSLIGRRQSDCWALAIGLEGTDYHLVLVGYPGDAVGLSIENTGNESIEIRHNLSFGFLEKGVIRRSRFLVSLVQNQPAISTAMENLTVPFYKSRLPLEV